MKRLVGVATSSLLVAACGAVPNDGIFSAPHLIDSSAQMSCLTEGKIFGSPGKSIAELAWCIAAKNNLWDPDSLFQKTLSISNYSTSEGITWGIQAGARPPSIPIKNFPAGISSILYQRVEPKPTTYPLAGHISLSVALLPNKTCVSIEDLVEVFGRDYWLEEKPIVAPAEAVPSLSVPSREASEIYGVIFRSPKLFSGDPSGHVNFDFEYTNCARNFTIYRNLDLKTHSNKGTK